MKKYRLNEALVSYDAFLTKTNEAEMTSSMSASATPAPSAASVSAILDSGAAQKAAMKSIGTSLTPMNKAQESNTSGGVQITNNNSFAIAEKDIQFEIQEALRKNEIASRMKLAGFKT